MPLRLSLDALEVLDAIDRRGSFAAAAEELHRVPSALTYAVQKLESDLDVLLFDRRGYRAALTAPGRELLDQGRHLLRAAGELERRVRRLAAGWEPELRIALDAMIPAERLFALIREFDAEAHGTRLRLSQEVLGGGWDALVSGRADLVIGLSGDGPGGGGCSSRPLGSMEFLFAVAPHHPLADAPEPIPRDVLRAHRAVAIGDTSRTLAPLSSGLIAGQDVLVVPDLPAKIAAQVAGLGCGFLPAFAAQVEAGARRLAIRTVEEGKPGARQLYAWRTENRGRALRWFLKKFEEPGVRAGLLGELQGSPAPRRRRVIHRRGARPAKRIAPRGS